MPIRLLPEGIAASIAAGEVVERAASVVKELLENAVDAGARTIEILASGPNLDRIVVTDDGSGMTPEDMALCLHRHATSKMPTEDIREVCTLGFRGEALPSIAHVADISITSRTADADSAFIVSSISGGIRPPRPRAGSPGTRVEVNGLFHRHPARLKFQKPARTEGVAIRQVVNAVALSYPQVTIRADIGGSTLRYPARADLIDRIKDVLGAPMRDDGIAVSHLFDGITVTGLTCHPAAARGDSKGMRLSVNGRSVTDRGIKAAVLSAYASLIGHGHHPQAYLSISLSVGDVDINVHPRKSEIRFSDPHKVSAAVVAAITAALDAAGVSSPSHIGTLARSLAGLNAADVTDQRRLPLGKYIGQASKSWLISETMDGIVIIDQHAAHERVILERLRTSSSEVFVYSPPEAVAMNEDQLAAVDESLHVLADMGFDMVVDADEIVLKSCPGVLAGCHPGTLCEELAAACMDGLAANSARSMMWERLATAACKAAIKSGQALTDETANNLLRTMEATPNSSVCNHGRPTVAFLKDADLAKLFARS